MNTSSSSKDPDLPSFEQLQLLRKQNLWAVESGAKPQYGGDLFAANYELVPASTRESERKSLEAAEEVKKPQRALIQKESSVRAMSFTPTHAKGFF
jgi:hypothetical protein